MYSFISYKVKKSLSHLKPKIFSEEQIFKKLPMKRSIYRLSASFLFCALTSVNAQTGDPQEDFDVDGLTKAIEEDFYGTLDTDSDSDDDTFPDGVEVASGSDPDDDTSFPTAGNVVAWDEAQKLVADDGTAYDSFGSSVFISGDYAL